MVVIPSENNPIPAPTTAPKGPNANPALAPFKAPDAELLNTFSVLAF
jgi:hypothetical protein